MNGDNQMVNVAQHFNTIANQIPADEWMDINQVAKSLNLGTLRARQLAEEAVKKRIVTKLMKKEGRKILYAEAMVDKIVDAYEHGLFGKKKNPSFTVKRSVERNALMNLEIPLYDKNMIDVLNKIYGSNEKIVEAVKDYLSSIYKPTASKLAELDAEYKAKRESLLGPTI